MAINLNHKTKGAYRT